jgi:hypothetical protein
MIGFYGIAGNDKILNGAAGRDAFTNMTGRIWRDDFHEETLQSVHYSVGIIKRNNGRNQDLALRAFKDELVIGFNGYGKFKGESKLCWAEEMTERIEPLVRAKGKDILYAIEGSFSCMVIHQDELFILGDRLSSKRLFYYDDENCIIFSPDVGGILDSGLVTKEKDLEAVSQILVSGFFIDDATLTKKVSRFPYGSALIKRFGNPSKSKIIRYWELPKNEGIIRSITPGLLEEFSSKLKTAIYELDDLESKSVVPLSGGLDSRAVACFLAKRKKIKALTYDLGDEVLLSKKVSRALKADHVFFSNDIVMSEYFRSALFKYISEQKSHAVANQYFYAPLFKRHFREHQEDSAVYDGVYLDILFSAPYTYKNFNFEKFFRTYGGLNIPIIAKAAKSLNESFLIDTMRRKYDLIHGSFEGSDQVGESQLFYANGRLKRYVTESFGSREDYCYVLKPGYNYELMDFGFSLGLEIRKGILYTGMLGKIFPEVMKIPYKDSYGNRAKTLKERIKGDYIKYRLKLSFISQGLFRYSPYQAEYFFLQKGRINDYRDMFMKQSSISEFFTDNELKNLFNTVKKKQYLFPLFQRVLFIQQFYSHHNFK